MRISTIVLVVFCACASSRKYHEIRWTYSDFHYDVKNNNIDVEIGDQLIINCPKFFVSYIYAKFHLVSDWDFDRCTLFNARWLGVCNNSNIDTQIRITFREITPTPDGLEFRPGQKYYIITTSSGDQEKIEQRSGGLCSTHDMRLRISVAKKEPTVMQSQAMTFQIEEYSVSKTANSIYTFAILTSLFLLLFSDGL